VDVVRRLVAERFGVYMVRLDPTVGSEMRKTRPCVVLSPEEMHRNVLTVIVAPLTSTITGFPTRVRSTFDGKPGEIALDQMRALDHSRFGRRLGSVDAATAARLTDALADLFS
jgi:mRNA interferase MazF